MHYEVSNPTTCSSISVLTTSQGARIRCRTCIGSRKLCKVQRQPGGRTRVRERQTSIELPRHQKPSSKSLPRDPDISLQRNRRTAVSRRAQSRESLRISAVLLGVFNVVRRGSERPNQRHHALDWRPARRSYNGCSCGFKRLL